MTSLAEQFKGGFSIGQGFECVEVLLDEERTRGNILAFVCYDANLFPLPNISGWHDKAHAKKIIDVVRDRTASVSAEVWLDDVKIKEYMEDSDER
jgi:hypothetical protein